MAMSEMNFCNDRCRTEGSTQRGLSIVGKSELIARIIESTEDVMILDDDEDDRGESIIDDDDEILKQKSLKPKYSMKIH